MQFNILMTVWFVSFIAEENRLMSESIWIYECGEILMIACSHSVNPLIYGTLDKNYVTPPPPLPPPIIDIPRPLLVEQPFIRKVLSSLTQLGHIAPFVLKIKSSRA
jgi:hypothetical protein